MTAKKQKQLFDKTTLLTAIKTSAVLKPERINIPELNGDVYVKRMTVGERDDYFLKMREVKFSGGPEAFIFAVTDENGQALFTEEDLEIVRGIPPQVTEPVLKKFFEINQFNRKAEDEVGDDLKNS